MSAISGNFVSRQGEINQKKYGPERDGHVTIELYYGVFTCNKK